MYFDGRKLQDNTNIECDVIIAGAGPAGISLALSLSERLSVVIIERGGLNVEKFLGAGSVTSPDGYSYDLESSRGTGIGGSSGLWNLHPGWQARPLDNMDFERREWIPESGWMINRSELEAYYSKAHEFLEMGSESYNPDDWIEEPSELGQINRLRGGASISVMRHVDREIFLRKSDEIIVGSRFRLFLHSAVVGFQFGGDGNILTSALVRSDSGVEYKVNARAFVLAAGGIENVGIILNSQISNRNKKVGYYFMEHMHLYVGKVRLRDQSLVECLRRFRSSTFPNVHGAVQAKRRMGRLIFCANLDICRRDKTANWLMWADLFHDRFESEGMRSLRELRRLRSLNIRAPMGAYLSHLRRAPGGLVDSAIKKLTTKQDRDLRYDAIHLNMEVEQVPNSESRVILSDDRDQFGMRRAKPQWRLHSIDYRTIERAIEGFGRYFMEKKIGVMRDSFFQIKPRGQIGGGSHHMGGTRMAPISDGGVVDANLKYFGIKNLYVAGSSSFPTSGASNPTLTIVALSIRLADHLNFKLAKQ